MPSRLEERYLERVSEALLELDRRAHRRAEAAIRRLASARKAMLTLLVDEAPEDGPFTMLELGRVERQALALLDEILVDVAATVDASNHAAWRDGAIVIGAGILAAATASDIQRINRVFRQAGSPGFDIRVPDPSLAEIDLVLRERGSAFVRGVRPRARQAITRQLRRAVTQQMPALAAAKDIAGWIDTPTRPQARFGGLGYQVRRFIVTDALSARSLAHQKSAQRLFGRLGAGGWKEWRHDSPKQARPSHAALHGKRIPMEELFLVEGFYARHPHAPELPVGQVANCLCRAHYGHSRILGGSS